jgi:hypothetical protein
VLNKETAGHKYDMESEATFFYHSLTLNSYVDMMKIAMWKAKEDMDCDVLSVVGMQSHDVDELRDDLKF